MKLLLVTGAVSVLLVGSAFAGPLALDATSIPAFTGTANFNSDNALVVDLDYAVFDPGVYPDDGVNGDDPSDGAEYVYAYQAFVQANSEAASTLSIGLVGGSGAGNAAADALHVLTGGDTPDTVSIMSASVLYLFVPDQLDAGEHSSVLLFTSPNPPQMGPASVLNSGRSDQQTAPTPVPEPGTLGLLALAGLAVLRRRP
jgi:MYXO-CTERM domain-containing protein